MVPFQQVFLPKFTKETGIKVHYQQTNYNAWYQNSKTDGLQKTGAYDIYVMDDNWVPEYAAGGIIQSMDKLGLKVNPDILAKGLDQGYWPPKSGPRLKAFASDTPAAVLARDHRRRRDPVLQRRPFPSAPEDVGRHLPRPPRRRPTRRRCTAGRPAAWPATRSCRRTCRC